ncbi:MAG: hypothetical protein H7A49_16485 [Akkermansiaceae bacterium]|nr:hypothetical protein [Akkermansiaceae bacterium]MCP5548210.1 hypothetical protein [Akkermansiaceae bacterium]
MASVGFLAAAITGWQLTEHSPAAKETMAAPENTRVSSGRSRSTERSGAPEWTKTSLAAIRAESDAAALMREVVRLAISIPETEIPRWLDRGWFPKREGFARMLFRELLLRRWEFSDPLALARWQAEKHPEEAAGVLKRLAATKPEEALAILRSHPWVSVRIDVLAEMAKTHPRLAMDGFLESVFEKMDPTPFFHALGTAAPELLEAELSRLPPYLRTQAEDELAGLRLDRSFDEEIRRLWESPDGWMRFHNNLGREGVMDRLFDHLSDLPDSWRQDIAEGDWFRFLWQHADRWLRTDLEGAGFSEEQAHRIRESALDGLSRDKPEAAISWLATLDLDTEVRNRRLDAIFLSGGRPLEELERLLPMLPTADDQAYARELISRQENAQPVPVPIVTNPAEWLDKVATAEPRSSEASQYRYMLHRWKPQALAELIDRIAALPDESRSKVAPLLAGAPCDYSSFYEPALQGEAYRWLAEHPDEVPDLVKRVSFHATKWAIQDPAAASAWVENLPAGEAKDWARNNLAACWRHYDPAAAERWISSLPESDRAGVRGFLK